MPIAVVCPSCGYRSGAKEEWVGRQVKCPGCGIHITVEEPMPPERPNMSAPRQRPSVQQRQPLPQRAQIRQRQTLQQRAAPRQRSLASRPAANGKRPVWIAAGAVGGLLLLIGVGVIASGALSQSKTPPPPQAPIASDAPMIEPPAWTSDPALVNQLPSEVSFDRYSLRLPAGYQPLNLTAARPAPPGVRRQTWAWCDAPAADGTRHVIEARLASAPDIPHTNSLDAEVNAYLQNAQADAGAAKFVSGTTAKGRVCGEPFARLTYSVATPQATVHTVSYLGFDGDNRMLTLVCACKEQEETGAFKLLEASLLSLQRN